MDTKPRLVKYENKIFSTLCARQPDLASNVISLYLNCVNIFTEFPLLAFQDKPDRV